MEPQTPKEFPKVLCETCGRLILKRRFNRHSDSCRQKDHNSELPKCPYPKCAHKTFQSKWRLEKHIKEVHSKMIKCHIDGCDAMMKPASVREHLKRVHENLKSLCEKCGNLFSYKNLKQHLDTCNVDKSIRPYECTANGCDSSFKTARDRFRHVQNVHSEPMQCPILNCTATFKNACLWEHIEIRHKNLKNQCGKCEKELAFENLRRHLRTCKGEESTSGQESQKIQK